MTTATDLFGRALITMAQRNEGPRCSDPVDHMRWTSESESDRAIAALWCTGCEVLVLCGHLLRTEPVIQRDLITIPITRVPSVRTPVPIM
jgi:hypothetical protein